MLEKLPPIATIFEAFTCKDRPQGSFGAAARFLTASVDCRVLAAVVTRLSDSVAAMKKVVPCPTMRAGLRCGTKLRTLGTFHLFVLRLGACISLASSQSPTHSQQLCLRLALEANCSEIVVIDLVILIPRDP